jgi:hypothetical protein
MAQNSQKSIFIVPFQLLVNSEQSTSAKNFTPQTEKLQCGPPAHCNSSELIAGSNLNSQGLPVVTYARKQRKLQFM